MNLSKISSADVSGKKVLLRVDLDVVMKVDLKNKVMKIADDTRLKASLQTITYLRNNGATVILAGHMGRPQFEDYVDYETRIKRNGQFSLKPVADWYATHVTTIQYEDDDDWMNMLGDFKGWWFDDNLYLLENLRFYPEEEKNDLEFAKKLAALADLYVNDAFATVHRAHASIVGVPKLLPHYAGLQLQEEITTFSKIIENPQRPLVVIVGGAKIETKLPLIEKMHRFADYVLVGGKIAQETRTLLKEQHEKAGHKGALLIGDLQDDGTDITELSAENFVQIVSLAKTVVWNGPLGKIQDARSQILDSSTKKIAKGIVQSNAYSVVGGGDTVGFLKEHGFLEKFSFVSTGGGAMLAFLSGEKLPGLEALVA